ncbi:MAG: RNA polymerase factor sigma-54, partial [Panacagrimonas sp.]
TPRGLFEFRHFFSRSLTTETGVACSAAAVRALMTDMLANEKDSKPLSDVALAKKLGENGVRVSRRTVTKYRNLMKVAPVELRKRA